MGAYEGMARKKDGALGPFGRVPPVFILAAEPTRLADASLRVGPVSAAESRVSAGPPFSML